MGSNLFHIKRGYATDLLSKQASSWERRQNEAVSEKEKEVLKFSRSIYELALFYIRRKNDPKQMREDEASSIAEDTLQFAEYAHSASMSVAHPIVRLFIRDIVQRVSSLYYVEELKKLQDEVAQLKQRQTNAA